MKATSFVSEFCTNEQSPLPPTTPESGFSWAWGEAIPDPMVCNQPKKGLATNLLEWRWIYALNSSEGRSYTGHVTMCTGKGQRGSMCVCWCITTHCCIDSLSKGMTECQVSFSQDHCSRNLPARMSPVKPARLMWTLIVPLPNHPSIQRPLACMHGVRRPWEQLSSKHGGQDGRESRVYLQTRKKVGRLQTSCL